MLKNPQLDFLGPSNHQSFINHSSLIHWTCPWRGCVCPRVRWLQIHANPTSSKRFWSFSVIFLSLVDSLIFDQFWSTICQFFIIFPYALGLYGNPPRSGPRKVSMPTLGQQNLGCSLFKVGSISCGGIWVPNSSKAHEKNHLKSRIEPNKLSQRFQASSLRCPECR